MFLFPAVSGKIQLAVERDDEGGTLCIRNQLLKPIPGPLGFGIEVEDAYQEPSGTTSQPNPNKRGLHSYFYHFNAAAALPPRPGATGDDARYLLTGAEPTAEEGELVYGKQQQVHCHDNNTAQTIPAPRATSSRRRSTVRVAAPLTTATTHHYPTHHCHHCRLDREQRHLCQQRHREQSALGDRAGRCCSARMQWMQC